MLLTAAFWQATWWAFALTALIAYMLGSINTAIVVVRLFYRADIRDSGSGNAGFTNVLRAYGKRPAILTAAGDLLKSLLSVGIGAILLILAVKSYSPDPAVWQQAKLLGEYVAGMCCVFGHMFPLYFNFHGGKGIMATFGMMLFVDIRVAGLLLAVFLLVFILGKMVSLASVCAALSYPLWTWLMLGPVEGTETQTMLFCLAVTAILTVAVVVKHRSNISRILQGTEHKFGQKKKEEG